MLILHFMLVYLLVLRITLAVLVWNLALTYKERISMEEAILGNEILPFENFLETVVEQRNPYEDFVRTDASEHVLDFP